MKRRRRGAVLALLLSTVVVLVATAAPASAHTDTATFSATRAEPAAGGTYTIDLLLTYDNDGHGAAGAALTVSVQGPTGGPVAVPMAPGDREGAYTGTVAVTDPGDYTVTASSTEPTAEATFTFTVADDSPTTTGAEAVTTTTAGDEAATTTTPADDEDSGSTVASVAANAALLLIGAVAAFFGLRWWRGRRDPGGG